MALTDDELFAAFDAAMAAFTDLPGDRWDAAVPACPGWTLTDLVHHQGWIQRWAALIVTNRPETRPVRDETPPAAGTDLVAWLREGAAALRAALVAADRDQPVYTFAGTRPLRWWLRRQVHESTVHAGDAAEALGGRFAVDPPVAVDGVDEVLEVFLPKLFDAAAFAGGGETAHLHATDAPGEWLLRFEPDRLAVTHEHAKGDVAVRAPAADLQRLAWGRSLSPEATLFGDTALLDRYRTACRF